MIAPVRPRRRNYLKTVLVAFGRDGQRIGDDLWLSDDTVAGGTFPSVHTRLVVSKTPNAGS
jgi:hypothetical protein